MNYRHMVQSLALSHYTSSFIFASQSHAAIYLGQRLYICCPMFVTRQACISNIRLRFIPQLLQQLKKLICDLCRLYNLPQHPDVEMLDQPLPADLPLPPSSGPDITVLGTADHILYPKIKLPASFDRLYKIYFKTN